MSHQAHFVFDLPLVKVEANVEAIDADGVGVTKSSDDETGKQA